MSLNINDEYFGELLPYVKNDSITDITWNGRDLWLDDLKRGRYKSTVKLSNQFVSTFATRIANLANKNFNLSEPLLEAETDELRISIVDGTVTNTNRSIAIRKTPAVRRLNELKMLEDGYAEALVLKLLEALVKGHSSIIVTGDVGSGKTELVKYLTKFIPPYERAISIEDNYELRLSSINPNLDCVEIKATMDGPFSYQMAIKAALRQLCKWLLMAEARSKEVINLLEAASTGCIVMTTLHSDDVRKIPDRVVNMMGANGEEKRNDVYNFFDVGIKVGIEKTNTGIKRSIDQICVMDRDDDENSLYLIYNKGFTGQTVPKNIWNKICQGAKEEIGLFEFLKPDNADSFEMVKSTEFDEMVESLEDSMKNEYVEKAAAESMDETPDIEDIDTVMYLFDELPDDMIPAQEVDDILDLFDELPEETAPEETSETQEEIAEEDASEEQKDASEEQEEASVEDPDMVTLVNDNELDEILASSEPEGPIEDFYFDMNEIERDPSKKSEKKIAEDTPEDIDDFLDLFERIPEEVPVEADASANEDIVLDDFYEHFEDDYTEPLDIPELPEDILTSDIEDISVPELEIEDVTQDAVISTEEPVELIEEEIPSDIDSVMDIFDSIPEFKEYGHEAFKGIDFAALQNLSGPELIFELKKQLTINWLNNLSKEDLVAELKREVEVAEECNRIGIPIPEHELIKIRANIERGN